MIIRTSTVLSVASLIAAFAGGVPGAAGEWATKEDAIAMVQRAMAFITQHGPEKAYAEITKKTKRFHDRDLYITVVDLEGKVLAHGQTRDLIGKNLINAKDPDGKLVIKERIESSAYAGGDVALFFVQTRQFASLADMAEEQKNVRVWGGVSNARGNTRRNTWLGAFHCGVFSNDNCS